MSKIQGIAWGLNKTINVKQYLILVFLLLAVVSMKINAEQYLQLLPLIYNYSIRDQFHESIRLVLF